MKLKSPLLSVNSAMVSALGSFFSLRVIFFLSALFSSLSLFYIGEIQIISAKSEMVKAVKDYHIDELGHENHTADQHLSFCYILYFQAFSHLWLYSLVSVRPGGKPRSQVFS